MSTYVNDHRPAPTAARPAVLTAATGLAVAVALLNVVTSILILIGVDDLTRRQIADTPGSAWGEIDPAMVDMSSERAEGLRLLYSVLAYDTIFWALVLAALAPLALRGGRAARTLAALILAITAAVKGLDAVMAMPAAAVAVDALVGVLAIVAIVLFFLPASNGYGRRRRAA